MLLRLRTGQFWNSPTQNRLDSGVPSKTLPPGSGTRGGTTIGHSQAKCKISHTVVACDVFITCELTLACALPLKRIPGRPLDLSPTLPVSKEMGHLWPPDWLPVQPDFYDRQRELEDLKRLTKISYKPVIIHGMGGIG